MFIHFKRQLIPGPPPQGIPKASLLLWTTFWLTVPLSQPCVYVSDYRFDHLLGMLYLLLCVVHLVVGFCLFGCFVYTPSPVLLSLIGTVVLDVDSHVLIC